jgi:hypothetical protein
VINKTSHYTAKQFNHLDSMDNDKTPKLVYEYKPKGHSDLGRPFKKMAMKPEQA